jgi:LysM repeat protein
LKALTEYTKSDTLAKQTISVTINDEVKEIEIGENPLDMYEATFTNINNENSFTIDMKKGKIYYEVVEDYYVDYSNLKENEDIKVTQTLATTAKVNDIISQNIKIENSSGSAVSNGLIQISIPQGCSVIENSLLQLKHEGIIEKYEYNYGTINLYIRNWIANTTKEFTIEYRAEYPENITGGFVRVYDYYNPTIEGVAKPENIVITE